MEDVPILPSSFVIRLTNPNGIGVYKDNDIFVFIHKAYVMKIKNYEMRGELQRTILFINTGEKQYNKLHQWHIWASNFFGLNPLMIMLSLMSDRSDYKYIRR